MGKITIIVWLRRFGKLVFNLFNVTIHDLKQNLNLWSTGFAPAVDSDGLGFYVVSKRGYTITNI